VSIFLTVWAVLFTSPIIACFINGFPMFFVAWGGTKCSYFLHFSMPDAVCERGHFRKMQDNRIHTYHMLIWYGSCKISTVILNQDAGLMGAAAGLRAGWRRIMSSSPGVEPELRVLSHGNPARPGIKATSKNCSFSRSLCWGGNKMLTYSHICSAFISAPASTSGKISDF
jgi:hypothetical protein